MTLTTKGNQLSQTTQDNIGFCEGLTLGLDSDCNSDYADTTPSISQVIAYVISGGQYAYYLPATSADFGFIWDNYTLPYVEMILFWLILVPEIVILLKKQLSKLLS